MGTLIEAQPERLSDEELEAAKEAAGAEISDELQKQMEMYESFTGKTLAGARMVPDGRGNSVSVGKQVVTFQMPGK